MAAIAAGLCVLAVIDNIDTKCDLTVNDFLDRVWQPGCVFSPKRTLPVAFDQLIQIAGPGQIAGVRYQDVIFTASQNHASFGGRDSGEGAGPSDRNQLTSRNPRRSIHWVIR